METANRNHPVYTSKHDFYLDVVMNFSTARVAHAPTRRCCSVQRVSMRRVNGTRGVTPSVVKRQGLSLWVSWIHFDSALKKDKGWLWTNLFMVNSDINRMKGRRAVDGILKPDAEDYCPFQKLEYDVSTHVFIPKSLLSEDLSNRVRNMILMLGLNHGTVRQHRMNLFSELLKAIEFGLVTWDTASPVEFPTAFAMVRDELEA